MKIGKTVKVGVAPKRVVKKANEPKPNPWKEQPIPVDIPKRKRVKKEVEADT